MLRHSRNLGQSRGIRSGVLAAKGDIIVTLDGDGQNDPADIPKLLALLRAEPDTGMVSRRARQAPGHRQPPHGLARRQPASATGC